MASDCLDVEDTFYTAASESRYYDVDEEEGGRGYGEERIQSPSAIVAQLQNQEEEARRTDHLLADKLDEIATTLRGGSSKESTPKCATPPMPLKEILCAVEKRLKEKIRESPSFAARTIPEPCFGKGARGPYDTPKRPRSPYSPRKVIQDPQTPLRPPPRTAFDPDRFAQLYFEDEEINMAADEDLRGTVGDILERRRAKKAQQCKPKSPGWRKPPVRQMQAYPMQQGEGIPAENEFELLGVTEVENSNYGESVRRYAPPPGRPRCRNRPQLPEINFSPDPFHGIDWKRMPEKSLAELIEDQRRMQEDEIIDQFARQLVQEKCQYTAPKAASTPKGAEPCTRQRVRNKQSPPRVRRWSPERLAALSRRFGIPSSGRAEPYNRLRARDRVGCISPPPEFYEMDEIDDCDVSF